MDGRVPTSPTCTVADDAAGRGIFARMCRARQSGRADRAPAEPPASGEAQRADGEVGRKGAAQHAVHCRWVSVRDGPTAGAGAQTGTARGKGEQYVAMLATTPEGHAFCTRVRKAL